MPLARIDLVKGKSADYRKTIGEVVYQAMVETLKAPKDDRFQVIAEHAGGDFIVDPNYLGTQRSKDCVIVQLTLNEGRTLDQKRAFIALPRRPEARAVGLGRAFTTRMTVPLQLASDSPASASPAMLSWPAAHSACCSLPSR
jgi:Tautomerase enzyme